MNAILAAILLAAAPTFVTPEMTYRRGLTDEQYEHLWKMGRNPSVDQATMRDWYFKSHRYHNCTNWLNIVGKRDDYAALSYTLQDENFKLEETNAVVVAENRVLVTSNGVLEVENAFLTETNAVLEVDAKKAQKVQKNAQKAKKKDEKNFNKWIEDTEKAKQKSSSEMAEFYDAVLDLARIYDAND